MSCTNNLWVLCDDGLCRQCGASQGYPTKEECIANKSRTWPVNCKEICNPACYNFSLSDFAKNKVNSSYIAKEMYTPCSFPAYTSLQKSWVEQSPYRT